MTNIIDMARKRLCQKRIDAAASNAKEDEKATIEEPPYRSATKAHAVKIIR